jgi:peptide/nickel transport system ATP-binding protein
MAAVRDAAPLLAVDRLRIEFPTRRGTLVAVHDVSFDIAAGEVLGVVGESGAGKSLTGAAIIGLIDPPGRIAAGQIHLSGRRIDNLPYDAMRKVRGREIGAVFQDPLTSLNPLYTVGQQLIETIRTHLDMSESAARTRAIGLLEEVGIPAAARRIDHYPHQFSGGMRQRVVIALALSTNPKLIVADEPTTAPAPTAASSSSPNGPRPTWTTATACSGPARRPTQSRRSPASRRIPPTPAAAARRRRS